MAHGRGDIRLDVNNLADVVSFQRPHDPNYHLNQSQLSSRPPRQSLTNEMPVCTSCAGKLIRRLGTFHEQFKNIEIRRNRRERMTGKLNWNNLCKPRSFPKKLSTEQSKPEVRTEKMNSKTCSIGSFKSATICSAILTISLRSVGLEASFLPIRAIRPDTSGAASPGAAADMAIRRRRSKMGYRTGRERGPWLGRWEEVGLMS